MKNCNSKEILNSSKKNALKEYSLEDIDKIYQYEWNALTFTLQKVRENVKRTQGMHEFEEDLEGCECKKCGAGLLCEHQDAEAHEFSICGACAG